MVVKSGKTRMVQKKINPRNVLRCVFRGYKSRLGLGKNAKRSPGCRFYAQNVIFHVKFLWFQRDHIFRVGSVGHNQMFNEEVAFRDGQNVIVLLDLANRNQTKTCHIFGRRGPDKYHAIFFWSHEARLGKLAKTARS